MKQKFLLPRHFLLKLKQYENECNKFRHIDFFLEQVFPLLKKCRLKGPKHVQASDFLIHRIWRELGFPR